MVDVSTTRGFLENYKSVILPLVAVGRDAKWHGLGTSFVVAVTDDSKKAFLLTAAHNMRYVQKIDARGQAHHATTLPMFLPKEPESIGLDGTEVFAVLVGSSGPTLALMIKSWSNVLLDIALVLVELREEDDEIFQTRIALDTRPVEEGLTVIAVGYPGLVAESTADFDTKEFRGSLEFQLQSRSGKVKTLCPQGIGIHKWPGFLVTSPFDSGMSGGPIIDLAGDVPTVRGIIGGDLGEIPEDGRVGSGVQAFASMLWPAMVISTEIVLGVGGKVLVPENVRLLDLVRHGAVDDRGRAHEHVQFEERDGTLTCSWVA